jgi:hypothetical protein
VAENCVNRKVETGIQALKSSLTDIAFRAHICAMTHMTGVCQTFLSLIVSIG